MAMLIALIGLAELTLKLHGGYPSSLGVQCNDVISHAQTTDRQRFFSDIWSDSSPDERGHRSECFSLLDQRRNSLLSNVIRTNVFR